MSYFKAAVAALCVASVLAMGAGTASADPTKSKNSELIDLNCDVNGPLTVALNGNGDWTPGHVTTSNQILKPYEIHITGTFTPTGGAPEPFSDDLVKRAPRNGRLDTCTFSDSGTDESGSFSLTGLVKVSYTPQH
jgi:hypothetical protein